MKFIIVIARPSPRDIERDCIRRFSRAVENFCDSLKDDLKVSPDDLILLPFTEEISFQAIEFQKRLTQAIIDVSGEDLCLVYVGHGQRNGWALNGIKNQGSITYRNLRLSLVHHSGRLIFLNNACYGGMGAYALDAHSGEHLLISPMPPTRLGCSDHFFGNLIESWKAGEFYRQEKFAPENENSRPFICGNEELQRLLFLERKTAGSRGSNV